jgi:hypothetical protein
MILRTDPDEFLKIKALIRNCGAELAFLYNCKTIAIMHFENASEARRNTTEEMLEMKATTYLTHLLSF